MKAFKRALVLLAMTLCVKAIAGESLVVKTADGNYGPAVASQWAMMGKVFRMVLRSGVDARQVAQQLADRLAPWKVEASGEATLVIKGEGVDEKKVLERLSGLEIELSSSGEKDELAALRESLGATLGDVSSEGSIRASKKIPLPTGQKAAQESAGNMLVGKVVDKSECRPTPTLTLEVSKVSPGLAKKYSISKGSRVKVKGYYEIDESTGKIMEKEPRTAINLQTKDIEPGQVVRCKLMRIEKDVWIAEEIRKVGK